MTKHLLLLLLISILISNSSCEHQKTDNQKENSTDTTIKEAPKNSETPAPEPTKTASDFVPEDFVLFEKVLGDLNKDGEEDCVLIIKGTDTTKFVQDEYQGELDRNRRGVIVLFQKEGAYEVASKNYDCFSSEVEDGGVYFPPELSVEIDKGKLYFHYGHGRYGYWKYTFRYQEDDFKLIGFDLNENHGPVMHYSHSFNFLTGKKQIRENTNFYTETPDIEVIKETWEDIGKKALQNLSSIEDFDDLYFE